jgi:hypothetical protein
MRFAIADAGFKDFFNVSLLPSCNDSGWRRRLLLSLKRIVGCGFEEGDVEYWMDLNGGRHLEFIFMRRDLFVNLEFANLFEVQLRRGSGGLQVTPLYPYIIFFL